MMDEGMKNSFAIYRLPGESCCTLMTQAEASCALHSAVELSGRSGFVLAPFAVSEHTPLLLIEPEQTETLPVDQLTALHSHLCVPTLLSSSPDEQSQSRYAIDFANFHAQLMEGHFQKLVLARNAFVEMPVKEPLDLFKKACHLYPQAFVALVSTPTSGTWLMATPEILLERKGQQWRTMALAGTMEARRPETSPIGGDGRGAWSMKNIQEQQYVATYIMQCLERFASDIHEEGPTTVQAANVMHLRSDFRFSLPDAGTVGALIHQLHPTPAVCGLPKAEAQDFILHNEAADRLYYSGFCGPLNREGESHLYVSLRCMQLLADGYRLYAGGGLLPKSQMQQEWNETEAKMEAMRQLIR